MRHFIAKRHDVRFCAETQRQVCHGRVSRALIHRVLRIRTVQNALAHR